MDTPVIYIVDDDPAVRDSLDALLTSQGFSVAVFASGDDLLKGLAAAETLGCILCDVRMPNMTGPDVQKALSTKRTNLPIIFMTGHGDLPMAVNAMKAGAFDFIEKPLDESVLVDRIKDAFNLSVELKRKAAESDAIEANLERLSPREREVLELMIEGHPNKLIAYKLDISARTVEIHRARVMAKMAARSLSQLVRLSMQAGVIQK